MNRPLIMLAPLAGYTNLAYRKFMKKFGCDIVVSEMISDYALIYQNKETEKMIVTCQEERPVAIQLFGGSLEPMLKGLEELEKKSDYDYLDINFGCPVHKVIKNNAGSAWLEPSRKEELYTLVKSLVEHSSKPVTCKVRLGINEEKINILETCKILEDAGASMITIHGRTQKQMYAGNASYDLIKKAKENSRGCKIIANGDINSLSKAIEVLEYTKADGIAIGRGCLGNPHLIKQIKTYFETGEVLPDATLDEQLSYLCEHYYALIDLKGEYAATQEIRGIGTWYLKGFTHVKEYKVALSQIKSKTEFDEIIEKIRSNNLIERA